MVNMGTFVSMSPEPISAHKFIVFLNHMPMGFSKISNMETVRELEAFHEGGVNNKTYSLQKPFTGERTLTFERGVVSRGLLFNELTKMAPGTRLDSDIIIIVYNRSNTNMAKLYFVKEPVVKSWRCTDLNAMGSDILLESIEIVYETMEQHTWDFFVKKGAAAAGFDPFSMIAPF